MRETRPSASAEAATELASDTAGAADGQRDATVARLQIEIAEARGTIRRLRSQLARAESGGHGWGYL